MNEDLLSSLMDEFGQGVWSYVYSMTKDTTTADDLAQEVFIQAYKGLNQFRQDSSVKTWLYAIAKNKVKDHFRSAFVRKVTISDRVEADAVESVEEQVLDSLQRNAVWDALLQLNADYREVVILHAKEDLAFKQVGEVMGISESTARVKYHRAVQQLRELLGKEMCADGIS
jgi:RNA polymerase sigma-70 factor, ECF subfamily